MTMNRLIILNQACIRAAVALTAVAIGCMTTFGASVWEDAVLWMNGPVDLNGDGKWNGNVGSPVPVKCDGTSSASELPDARHGALAYSSSQVVSYATANQTVYENSGFQIRTNDVHFTAWGNKTVKWPCLYLPQAPSGDPDAPYAQRMDLFADGGCPITGNNWSVLFRCRIEDCFRYNWGGSWLLCITTTDLGGAKELRIGFNQGGWTQDFSSPYYVGALIGGGAGSTAFTGIPAVKTNEWLEVALTVEGQKWRMSCATTNGVRWSQTYYVPGNHGSYSTNFIPATISLGGPRAYGVRNGSDNFCGDIQMFAMWNRALSDREVCEAFGGGAPNRFRIGEEGCTAEMYGGAAPAAGDTVTLDPLVSDKRAFPTTLMRGATFNMPFSVDKYAAGLAHWLRFVPQEGSSGGAIAVAVDGNALDPLNVMARGVGAAGQPALIFINGDVFTEGDHVLTLTRTDGGSGNVVFDVIELGGSWSAGVDDNSTSDGTSNGYLAGGYASDTWYADSLNLKEFVYATSRNPDDSNHRAKRIIWNLPQGVAERFDMRLSYNVLWFGESPMTNSLVTYVNEVPVHTNSSVGWTTHVFATDVLAESGLFRDGENEIKIDFLPCSRTESVDWATFDMIAAEPMRLHRLKLGLRIEVR